MIQTRRTCVLAMSRLTDATVNMLRQTPLEDWPVMGAPMGPDMLMIWAPTDIAAHGLQSDLRDALAWARNGQGMDDGSDPPTFNGFDYVIFDRDVDPLEDGCDLPVYGYEVPGEAPTAESILRDLLRKANDHDNHLNDKEIAPNGDDYNALMELIHASGAALENL